MNIAALTENRLRIGFLTGGVLVAVVAATLAWPLLSFGHTEYRAEFARVAGLDVGDEVRIAGVGVGKVRSIELAGDHVEVAFAVEDDVDLGSETRAEIKLATLLGSTFLDVHPAGAGSLNDGVIPERNTFTTFQVQDLIEGGADVTAKLDGNALRRALQAMTATLPDNPETVRRTLDGLMGLSDVIVSRDEELDRLLASMTSVADTVQAHGADVMRLIRRADVLLQVIASRKQAIHDILVHVRMLSRNLSATIRENAGAVRPLLADLGRITTILKRRDDELDDGLRMLGAASRYLTNATGDGPFIQMNAPYFAPDNALCAAKIIEGCQ